MGLDITYTNGTQRLSFRLPFGDIEILDYLSKKGFEKEMDSIFGVKGFGKKTVVKRNVLLDEVERLLKVFKNKTRILPHVYLFKEEIPRGSGMFSTGSGGASGFKIKGIPHSLEAGLEKCELSKMRQNNSGKWEEYNHQDVRHLKTIKVDEDNFSGDITIYKKRKPTQLIKNLEKLHSFLLEGDSEEIVKILG